MNSPRIWNRRIFAGSFLLGLNVGVASLVVDGCGAARLTPEEASAQLDVACSALVRTLVEHDDAKVASIASEVCHAEVTKAFIQRAAEHFEELHQGELFTDQAPIFDTVPSDAGARRAP
jgi:hypothetical protein